MPLRVRPLRQHRLLLSTLHGNHIDLDHPLWGVQGQAHDTRGRRKFLPEELPPQVRRQPVEGPRRRDDVVPGHDHVFSSNPALCQYHVKLLEKVSRLLDQRPRACPLVILVDVPGGLSGRPQYVVLKHAGPVRSTLVRCYGLLRRRRETRIYIPLLAGLDVENQVHAPNRIQV